MDPRALPVAQTHGGAFTAQQTRKWCRWEELSEWTSAGLIVRDARSVFRLADADGAIASRIARAELTCGRALIARHQTAAELYGFGVLPTALIHVTTADGRSMHAPVDVRVHQMSPRSPVLRVGGCWAVHPADIAIDVAAAAREIDVLAVLDAALSTGLRREQLVDAATRARRLRGIIEVRRQLPLATALAESPMESRTRYQIHQAGLPAPEVQIAVPIPGRGHRRLDLGWRQQRVGLEFDGQEFHSGDGSLDRDRRRGAELVAAGWTVVHVTARDVYRPERFTEMLRSLLRQRDS